MVNTSKNDRPSRRDVAYYRQRQKNRVFSAIASFFAEEAAAGKISKKELANKLGKDPSQITRLLSGPTNLELDTISDILLAMGAEMDHSIVRFVDRLKPNYAHPAIARYSNIRQFGRSTTSTAPVTRADTAINAVRITRKPGDTAINPPAPTVG
jgi:transcriptional regulator with XRE-family HTH domain